MIMDVKDLSKSFGPLKAVDGVSFSIAKGQTLAIVGESGCGKTTLAKILVGLSRPDSGSMQTQAKLQMVFQDPFSSLDPRYTVQALLEEAFYAQKHITKVECQKKIEQVLVSVGLGSGLLSRYPHEFSGGQRQRIAIARALLTQSEVLVLDEITSSLDVLVQKKIIELLKDLRSRLGLTYIFISHNLRVVKDFADTIAVMREGRIVEVKGAVDLFADPAHPYTKELLSAAFSFKTD